MITLRREYSSPWEQINTPALGNIYVRAAYRWHANRMQMSASVHRYELSTASVMCICISEVAWRVKPLGARGGAGGVLRGVLQVYFRTGRVALGGKEEGRMEKEEQGSCAGR